MISLPQPVAGALRAHRIRQNEEQLVLGGVAYSVGAIAYAAKRPDPWPRVFGYHEVFHSFTIMGSASHFVAVAVFLLPR